MPNELTALTVDVVQEAGKIQGCFAVLTAVMDKFPRNRNLQLWCREQMVEMREKNREVYSMLRVIE